MTYPRFLFPKIQHRLRSFPVVLLIGPRQSGKTTLMLDISKTSTFSVVSFDSITDQATATADPSGFITYLKKPVLIDEVQRVPEIFLPIKLDVDKHRSDNGRYALTGSANPLLAPKLGDALTGRMALLHLWPLSQGEILGKEENFLSPLFSDEFGPTETFACSKESLTDKLLLGGFPSMHLAHDQEAREAWCDAYLSLTLQKDIQQLAHIEGLSTMPTLLQIIATRVGTMLNYSSLSNASKIPLTSLRRYVQLLHSLFLIHTLPPWSKNMGKRLVKSPKVYFVDTAILLYSLRFNRERLLENPPLLGAVLENFVVNELCKQISWNTKRIELFHCRFSDTQAEIDLVLEDERGRVVGIEIKSSEQVGIDDFKHFNQLEKAAGENFLRGIVLYAGTRKLPFGPKRWAVPISALWSEPLP